MNHDHRFVRHLACAAMALALTCAGGFAAPAQATTVDLSAAPPDLSKTVDPNIVVTFDDSGSMAWTAMGDNRPFDDGSWDGKWACANTLDPSAAAGNVLALTMNGVYYNPNTDYLPPLYADGSSFPNADATLKAVWNDGIDANKPRNPDSSPSTSDFVDAITTTVSNKTDNAETTSKDDNDGTCADSTFDAYYVPDSCEDYTTTNWKGKILHKHNYKEYKQNTQRKTYSAQCGQNADADSCTCTTLTTGTGHSTDDYNTQCQWTETKTSDNRWTCSASASSTFKDDKSPLPDDESGPYYYTYTGPAITTDKYGSPDSTSISNIYSGDNWTAVQVPTSQYQNWANWWAYYHTRNMMTRTALSRVFGALGGNIRVAWQNINSSTFDLSSKAIMANLVNAGSTCKASSVNPSSEQTDTNAQCYRDAFFNWIYDTGANGGTPDRGATKRAGAFYSRSLTKNALDPYWNGKANTNNDNTIAADLSCRQNYQMLVTDGYWNQDSGITTPNGSTLSSSLTLPDGTAYDGGASSPTAIYKAASDANSEANMADIAFYYWAHDLQPDLDNGNVPYMRDILTGITDTTPLLAGDDPLKNSEIYWNPNNDPATWQHMVNYMVTLGINGYLHYSDDTDCIDKTSDACLLRKGDTNSTGSTDWPQTTRGGGSIGSPATIDDMWHAALASRGSYFSASNPSVLVSHLSQIIHNISARAGSAVANTVNSGVWTTQSVAYQGSYNSADWSGTVKAYQQTLKLDKDADGNVIGSHTVIGNELWDANCLLTGGGCISGGTTIKNPVTPPDDRVILTSSAAGAGHGVAFQWDDLSASEQQALNTNPATDVSSLSIVSDDLGSDRLDWLRGDRSKEGSELRSRGSIMGPVIRSQPLYVAYPDSNYRDTFPKNSDGTAAPENSYPYEKFVADNKARTPMLYVGANDGMLHAIRADDGHELFAYVPESVYWRSLPTGTNGDKPGVPNLGKLTAKSNFTYKPTVDNTPVKRDVFFGTASTGAWHTLLVGTLGMGGRGVFALDVTKPDSVTEANAASTVLWEFNSTSDGGTDLGYTYGQPEIARLATGKWAVLVPGGYFPQDPLDPNHSAAGAALKYSSLFVLDAQTGKLIKEIKTSDSKTGSADSFGLATPVLGDYQSDQVDDVAFAGDLLGNLWRFDLSSSIPDNWQVDLVYKGATDKDGNPTQPITDKPRLFPDPATNQFIVVFGTGKYLGASDRLRSGTPDQAVYGIREQGASGTTGYPASYYPIDASKLVTQTLVDKDGIRYLTNHQVAGNATGWVIPLDTKQGERVVQRAGALFNTNQALINTLIPGGDDPCNPNLTGGQFLISATTGGASDGVTSLGEPLPPQTPGEPPLPPVGCEPGTDCAGKGGDGKAQPPSISDSGSVQPVIVEPGGCRGVTASGMNIPMSCWRRRAWKVLLDNQP